MVGWSDIPADLSDTRHVARVARHLPAGASVVTSDLSRARETATALGLAGPRLPEMPGLREIHFGDWEMKRFDEIADTERIRDFWDQPGDVAPPGGESWNAFSDRVDKATDTFLEGQHKDIIVVCHFGVILRMVQRALGLSAREAFGHRIENLSVTRIDVSERGWKAVSINHHP